MNQQNTICKTNADKFLLFSLRKEEFGIEILRVREIISAPKVIPLPQTATYFKGVMSLRGQLIPVVDLRTMLGLPVKDYDRMTCTIVVDVDKRKLAQDMPDNLEELISDSSVLEQLNHKEGSKPVRQLSDESYATKVGVTVDSVSEVIQFQKADIEELHPSNNNQHWSDYLLGIAKRNDRIISLLNINEVFRHNKG